jgi:hypothetical protein
MVTSICSNSAAMIGQSCSFFKNHTTQLKHKITLTAQAIFDRIAPHQSCTRYILKTMAPKVFKVGCLTGAFAGAIFVAYYVGDFLGSQFENKHHETRNEILYDTALGLTIFCVPVYVGSMNARCSYKPLAMLKGMAVTVPILLLNWTAGHYCLKFIDGEEQHSIYHSRSNLLAILSIENAVGAKTLIMAAIPGWCIFKTGKMLYEGVKVFVKDHKKWREQKQQLIEMEEGKTL